MAPPREEPYYGAVRSVREWARHLWTQSTHMNSDSPQHTATGSSGFSTTANPGDAATPEGLAALIELFRPYLLYVAEARMSPRLRPKAAPSDLVQQTIMEAIRDAQACRAAGEAGLRTWLRGILLHNLGDIQRRYAGTTKRQIGRELSLDDSRSGALPVDLATDRGDPPSRRLHKEEQRDCIARTLASLSQEHQRVLALYYFQGQTFDAIGEAVGKTRGAAERLVKRALKAFARQYAHQSREP